MYTRTLAMLCVLVLAAAVVEAAAHGGAHDGTGTGAPSAHPTEGAEDAAGARDSAGGDRDGDTAHRSSDASTSVVAVGASFSVPLGNPAVTCKVVMDARQLATGPKRLLVGSGGLIFEVPVLGLGKLRVSVKGALSVFSEQQHTVAEMATVVARHVLRMPEAQHSIELDQEKLFAGMQTAIISAFDRAQRRVLENQHVHTHAQTHTRVAHALSALEAGDVEAARSTLGAWEEELAEGLEWPLLALPLEFKLPAMQDVLDPWMEDLEVVRSGLLDQMRQRGMDVERLGARTRASDGTLKLGYVGVFVAAVERAAVSDVHVIPRKRAPDVFVRVAVQEHAGEDVHDVTVTRTVHDATSPVFLEELRVPVFDRTSSALRIEVVDADPLLDEVLHTLVLPADEWLRTAEPHKLHHIHHVAHSGLVVRLVVRWTPFTFANAWAHLAPTEEADTFTLRNAQWVRGLSHLCFRDDAWAWRERSGTTWRPLTPRTGASVGTHNDDIRLVLHYLATTREAPPTPQEHVNVLLQDLIFHEREFVADMLINAAKAEADAVRGALGALEPLRGEEERDGARMGAALRAVQALAPTGATMRPGSSEKRLMMVTLSIMKSRLDALVSDVEKIARLMGVGAMTAMGPEEEEEEAAMRVGLNLVASLGGELASPDDVFKVSADFGAGWGAEGMLPGPLKHFRTFLLPVTVKTGPLSTNGFVILKSFSDGSRSLSLFVDVTMPVAVKDADKLRGGESARKWLARRLELARVLEMSLVTALDEVDAADGLKAVVDALGANVADSLEASLRNHPKLFSGAAAQDVKAALSLRLSTTAGHGESFSAATPSAKVVGYVTSKQSVGASLKLLGLKAGLSVEGYVDTGFYLVLGTQKEIGSLHDLFAKQVTFQ